MKVLWSFVLLCLFWMGSIACSPKETAVEERRQVSVQPTRPPSPEVTNKNFVQLFRIVLQNHPDTLVREKLLREYDANRLLVAVEESWGDDVPIFVLFKPVVFPDGKVYPTLILNRSIWKGNPNRPEVWSELYQSAKLIEVSKEWSADYMLWRSGTKFVGTQADEFCMRFLQEETKATAATILWYKLNAIPMPDALSGFEKAPESTIQRELAAIFADPRFASFVPHHADCQTVWQRAAEEKRP